MASALAINSFWADKALYDDAEKKYYENLAKLQAVGQVTSVQSTEKPKKDKKSKQKNVKAHIEVAKENVDPVTPQVYNGNEKKDSKKNKNKNLKGGNSAGVGGGAQCKTSLAGEVAKAREHIKTSLENVGLSAKSTPTAVDNVCRTGACGAASLAEALSAVQGMVQSLEKRVAALEIKCASCAPSQSKPASATVQSKPTPSKPTPAKPAEDDDDVDLFGSESEEEDEEAIKIKEQRVAEYAAKKSKKPALIAKSSIILDVKPWDDETDMKELEGAVRAIEMDGLLWGASKLVPLAYGIHKLQITCVVEDDKVSVDLLTENIEAISELVQSVDIAAFNKI